MEIMRYFENWSNKDYPMPKIFCECGQIVKMQIKPDLDLVVNSHYLAVFVGVCKGCANMYEVKQHLSDPFV